VSVVTSHNNSVWWSCDIYVFCRSVPGSYLEGNWCYRAVERIGPELIVESSDHEISVQAYVEDFILCVTVTVIFSVV
jgi:hypothetical protein